jgi:cob(I)alamin adenosyltransferase
MNDENETKDHREKMKAVKEEVRSRVKEAREDKGLILVLTGDGKGKSSSGLGMLLRCLGYKMKAGVVQFIKGKWETGEQLFLEQHPEVEYHHMGQGFTWDTQDKAGDIARAEECWKHAEALLSNPEVQFVLLDELCVVLSFEYLPLKRVLTALQNKPADQHVVVTGRGAPKALIDIADTVSQIDVVKHAFENGIRAQKGIEF